MDGFNYVVNPPVLPKVAFGTTMHRKVMNLKGPFMNGFMKKNLPEPRTYPSPIDYNCSKPIGFKYPSKYGFSALANKMPRLPIMPVPVGPKVGRYDPDPWIMRGGYTFDKFVVPEQKWLSPGPSTYTVHNKYPGFKVDTMFWSRRVIWPAVAVICGPKPEAVCSICEQKPKGDYFRNFAADKDMCRNCMHAELAAIRDCKLCVIERYRRTCQIRQYVPARYCGFFHGHEGTTAHAELISRRELRQKIRIENYLYRFETKVGYENF